MTSTLRPRLGFLGLGWIGRHRLAAVCRAQKADIVALADPDPEARTLAGALAPGAAQGRGFEDLIDQPLDGLVIATPSAQHASQAIAALDRGVAVFCQKPLARTRLETDAVLDAARRVDRPLGVDLCYPHTRAVSAAVGLAEQGALGEVFAASFVFHNAYGPDRAWFYDPAEAGGGCLMDLGAHLVDLALVSMPGQIRQVTSRLFSHGRLLDPADEAIEDFALVHCDFSTGAIARIECSWKLAAGRDAAIEFLWYGTTAGARVRNIGGSFYDFAADRFEGTKAVEIVSPPDDWGGRAILEWIHQLAEGAPFDPISAARWSTAAGILDAAYGRAATELVARGA